MAIIRQIRDIDSEKITIKLPKEFMNKRVEIFVFPIEKLEKMESVSGDMGKKELNTSGLCGIWKDERSPEEIIDDIHSHRTGFGNRQVEL